MIRNKLNKSFVLGEGPKGMIVPFQPDCGLYHNSVLGLSLHDLWLLNFSFKDHRRLCFFT